MQSGAREPGRAGPSGRHDERDFTAEQRQGLAVFAEKRARLVRGCALVELFEDPARLFVQETLDLAPGRAQRGRHGKPVFADPDADGAPAPALEAELDRASAEQRMARGRRVRERRLVEQR